MKEKMNYKPIDEVVKETLGNHELPYDSSDWKNIEKELPKKKGGNNFFKGLIFSTVILSVVAIVYFNNTDVTPIKIEEKLISSNNDINESKISLKEDVTSIIESNENNTNEEQLIEEPVNNPNKKIIQDYKKNNNSKEIIINEEINTDIINKEENEISDAIDIVNVTENETIKDISIKANSYEGCVPFEIVFSSNVNSKEGSYSWEFSNGIVSSEAKPRVIFDEPGTYTAKLIYTLNNNSILSELNNDIIIKEKPDAYFNCGINGYNVQFENLSQSGVNFVWSFGDGGTSSLFDPTYEYSQEGNYDVVLTVYHLNGCKVEYKKQIEIEYQINFKMPNGFTPNNDGINDYFGPVFESSNTINYTDYKMTIFSSTNRVLVFESNDFSYQWDGKILNTNEYAPSGHYVYEVVVKDSHNNYKSIQGTVYLKK